MNILIVGAGFSGLTFAYLANKKNHKVTVIDSKDHIGGSSYSYTDTYTGIEIHKYGAHIFKTNNDEIWNFINKFSEFNDYVHNVLSYGNDSKIYNFPINLHTINTFFNKNFNPEQAKQFIESKIKKDKYQFFIDYPLNLEQKCISMVGYDLYKNFFKYYTEKQWCKKCNELPSSIINRIPFRYNYDFSYFPNPKYQGIPKYGYGKLFESMTENMTVILNKKFNDKYDISKFDLIVYTGPIDEFFNYKYGKLEYRSLEWDIKSLNINDYQGNSVINYCDKYNKYTRVIEFKHFQKNIKLLDDNTTIIAKEYPCVNDDLPLYPIMNDENIKKYKLYKHESNKLNNFIFLGRLAQYQYIEMEQAIGSAINKFKNKFGDI